MSLGVSDIDHKPTYDDDFTLCEEGIEMSLPRPLLSRLYHDLAELLESPYPGVSVVTDDSNMRKFCLVLTPPSGPWKDLALHFDVELPHHWPASPPMIFCSVNGITHPNILGNWICCDLLKEQEELEAGYSGGYSPALTLRGLFLQFLTFFSSTKVEQTNGTIIDIGDYILHRYEYNTSTQEELKEVWDSSTSREFIIQDGIPSPAGAVNTVKEVRMHLRQIAYVNPRWHAAYKLISKWRCKKCSYGSESFPIHRSSQLEKTTLLLNGHPDFTPSSSRTASPPPCLLGKLNDDVLIELAHHLQLESLVSFAAAYPRFRHLLTSRQILLQRELRCFFLRKPLRDSILGIGIAFDPGSRTFSSDFDWLSKEAFDEYDVRTSIQKHDFRYFLPLAFSRTHFERVEPRIWEQLAILDTAVRDAEIAINVKLRRPPSHRIPPPRQPHQTVEIIYKMMTNIVVSLMKTCDDVFGEIRPSSGITIMHASEKAVIAYGHLFHLLLCMSRAKPIILQEATERIYLFLQNPRSRVKSKLPNLGEFIVLVTLVLAFPPTSSVTLSWSNINGPFLQEAFIRNARWDLKRLPVLEMLEDGCSDFRLAQTFLTSTTSLRLIMFQIAFLDIFVGTYGTSEPTNLARLDDNYGFPDPVIPERIVREVKAIYRVNTWRGFFERVRYKRGLSVGKARFSEMLKDAVRISAERRYHSPKGPKEMRKLQKEREEMERRWITERYQKPVINGLNHTSII